MAVGAYHPGCHRARGVPKGRHSIHLAWGPLCKLFLRFAGVGSLGSDFGVTWFCCPSPFGLLLWGLVSDVRRFYVVLGPPCVTLLIIY